MPLGSKVTLRGPAAALASSSREKSAAADNKSIPCESMRRCGLMEAEFPSESRRRWAIAGLERPPLYTLLCFCPTTLSLAMVGLLFNDVASSKCSDRSLVWPRWRGGCALTGGDRVSSTGSSKEGWTTVGGRCFSASSRVSEGCDIVLYWKDSLMKNGNDDLGAGSKLLADSKYLR